MSVEKQPKPDSNNYKSLLSYYKEKVEALESERETWLAKLEECSQQILQKQQKQQQLRKLKGQQGQIEFGIVHHAIAQLDEQLNSLNMNRLNQNVQFQQAEQMIKMRELAQQFPIVADKYLPCLSARSSKIIDNDLNLHNRGNGGKYLNLNISQGSITNNPDQRTSDKTKNKNYIATKQKNQKQFSKKSDTPQTKNKKALEEILKMQIHQTQKENDKELLLLEQQQKLLEKSINELREGRKKNGINDGKKIGEIHKKYNELEKKHKQLAENYFSIKRQNKQKNNDVAEQSQKLRNTYKILSDKIAEIVRTYEKENKAKQALIIRKSQDFQQDYKARMRAKQRNLQSLKESYEKMQQIYIDEVRKLQATLERARYQLQDAQEKQRFSVDELRDRLGELQKRVNEQRIEKARIDLRLRQKMLEEKERQQLEKKRQEKQRKLMEKDQMLKTAYKKTKIPQKSAYNNSRFLKQKDNLQNSKDRTRDNQRPKKTKDNSLERPKENSKMKDTRKKDMKSREELSDQGEDSLEMSDLDNIRRQINELEKKIAKEEKQDQ